MLFKISLFSPFFQERHKSNLLFFSESVERELKEKSDVLLDFLNIVDNHIW